MSGCGPSPPDSIQLQTIQSSQATPLFSMTQTSTEAAGRALLSNHVPSHALPGNIVLVKCLGNLQDTSITEQYNVKVSYSFYFYLIIILFFKILVINFPSRDI